MQPNPNPNLSPNPNPNPNPIAGFYPTGRATTTNARTPSGALVKAVLVNGAAAMDGFTADGLPVEPPPSCRQGFGRLHLASSLPLAQGRCVWDWAKVRVRAKEGLGLRIGLV